MPTSANERETDLRFSIRTPAQLAERCKELGPTEYIIDGMIAKQSLSLVVGDSGLGKSPLLYQAAACVAAALPFLGHTVRPGRVLYLDCENGLAQVEQIVSQVSKFLGLEAPPDDLLLWNLNDSDGGHTIKALVKEAKPNWVIIDPLNAFFPDVEAKSQSVTTAYQELRRIMSAEHCSITGIHHIRKPSQRHDEAPSSLDGSNYRQWFLQTRGARALINGCDTRIGVDLPSHASDDSKLIVRGFSRVSGEIPLTRLCRVLDEDGEPQGFKPLCGVDLLDAAYRSAHDKLPEHFRFKRATEVYGRGDQATADFLRKCEAAGLLRKLRGWSSGYEKIAQDLAVPEVGVPAYSGVSGANWESGAIPMTIQ